jgi:LTXXQ motif family protein
MNTTKLVQSMLAALALAAAPALAHMGDGEGCGGMMGGGPGMKGGGPGMQGGGHGMMQGGGHGMMHGGGPGAAGDPVARMDTRLETLRTELKIQPSQQGAWQAYAKAVRAQAADMADHHAEMAAGKNLTAPERMASHAERMREHAAGMTQVSNALRDLYAVLDAGQRAKLDSNAGSCGGGRVATTQ